MSTDISAENEKLIREAVASGRFENRADVLNQALRLLRDEESENGTTLADGKQWEQVLANFISRHSHLKDVEHQLDDSRDSIYADRDE